MPNVVHGTDGNNVLFGSSGDDLIRGKGGDDIIVSGAGDDVVYGGSGNDLFLWQSAEGNDYFSGGGGRDTAAISSDGGIDISTTATGALITDDGSTFTADYIEVIEVSLTTGGLITYNGDLSTTKIKVVSFDGSNGADIFDASGTVGFNSTSVLNVFGNDGDDTFYSGSGADKFDGGSGIDRVVFSGVSSDYRVTIKDGLVRVVDLNPADADGDRGTDTYDSVERIEFSDHTVLVVGENEYASIEDAVLDASSGDVILIADEAVPVSTLADATPGQVIIDKDLTIMGSDESLSRIEAVANTGGSGDSRGMFLVDPGVILDVSDVKIDGSGFDIYQAFRTYGSGEFDNVSFSNIAFGSYLGTGVAVIGNGVDSANVDVVNSDFSDMGRIGAQWFGTTASGTYSGNTYVGKGAGDHLDYAVEVGGGATVDIVGGNQISDVGGIASVDGSLSAGILVSTYFGPGTTANIGDMSVQNSLIGVAIGYDLADASSVTFLDHQVNLNGNTLGLLVYGNGSITNANFVNGSSEWYGGDADNMIVSTHQTDLVDGGLGNDTIQGYVGNDTIYGNSGDDILRGDPGNDSLFGDAGMDQLFGGLGDDILNGGDGDGADDTLSGGDGADIFAFTGFATNNIGDDTIVDWQDGLDFIAFDADMVPDLVSAGQQGADFVFDFGSYSVTVLNAGGQTFTQGALGSGADYDFFV